MIPRILHLAWVGDEAKRPAACIQSWIDRYKDWDIRIWGNDDLKDLPWINQRHIDEMAHREWNGVVDMMRYEILFRYGGFFVDADSWCLEQIPDWMLKCEAFCCWENELVRPGLLAAGYLASEPGTLFLNLLIQDIRMKRTVTDDSAWKTVGPLHLTETWRRLQYNALTVFPSHFFIPRHYTGLEYTKCGPVYASQEWGSTLRSYDQISKKEKP